MHSTYIQNTLICVVLGLLFIYIYYAYMDRSDNTSTRDTPFQRISNGEKQNDEKEGPAIHTALGYINYAKAESEIFKQLGLVIEDKKPFIPKLKYGVQPKCSTVYSQWLEKSKDYNESAAPPKEIPNNWKDNYTLGGYTQLKMGYMDDRSGVKTAKWDMVEDFIKKPIDFFKTQNINYGTDAVNSFLRTLLYGSYTSVISQYNIIAMYNAMKLHHIEGLEGAVIGSLTPWVESFALQNGAKKVTTIEYMKIEVVGTDKVEYIHPIEVAKNAEKYFGKFDFAASYSSMEHSGLGRYGDVPDPIGDIREMLKVRCLIKDGGLFFFGVPMGPDALYWNLHRVYGRIRLAIMFAGFELLNIFERDNTSPIEIREEDFGPSAPLFSYARQPVFVLKKI